MHPTLPLIYVLLPKSSTTSRSLQPLSDVTSLLVLSNPFHKPSFLVKLQSVHLLARRHCTNLQSIITTVEPAYALTSDLQTVFRVTPVLNILIFSGLQLCTVLFEDAAAWWVSRRCDTVLLIILHSSYSWLPLTWLLCVGRLHRRLHAAGC
jgi:hypothetical protein